MRIAIVGAGPAGCAAALELEARLGARAEIVVFERTAPGLEGGFGVVLPPLVLARLAAGGARWSAGLRQTELSWNDLSVVREGESVQCQGHPLVAVSRRRLLRLMRGELEGRGVKLRHGRAPRSRDLTGADLVVAADGARSRWRDEVATGVHEDGAELCYAWFATQARFERLTFLMRVGPRGVFTAHAYPYAPGRSAFIVEAPRESWGGAVRGGAALARRCESIFAPDLQGAPLLDGPAEPRAFRTVRLPRWVHGSTVVIGDAAHTAHFSIGSGTALALGDGLALADAVATGDPLPDALAAYERGRRPAVEQAQQLSILSARWWTTLEHRWASLSPERLAWSLLTRTGQYTVRALRRSSPALAGALERQVSEAQVPWPRALRGVEIDALETLSVAARERLRAAEPLLLRAPEPLRPPQRLALIDRLQTYRERVWSRGGAATFLSVHTSDLDWAEAQLWAGRVHGVVDATQVSPARGGAEFRAAPASDRLRA